MHKPPSFKCVFFNQKNSVFIIILFCDLIRGGKKDVLNRISCCKLSAISVNGSSNIVSYFW